MLGKVGQVQANPLGVEHGLVYHEHNKLQPDFFKKAEVKSAIPSLIYEKYKILEPDSSYMTPGELGNKLS